MSTRSLNKVILIGNLTRDPEMRYTPAGTAVCTFGIATNRSWTTQAGEVKEETEFHRIVAWNKLGELCAQLLSKGRKVYVEGRLATHSWSGQDGVQRTTTEVVIEDMIILDSKKLIKDEAPAGLSTEPDVAKVAPTPSTPITSSVSEDPKVVRKDEDIVPKPKKTKKSEEDKEQRMVVEEKEKKVVSNEDITPDDIPF